MDKRCEVCNRSYKTKPSQAGRRRYCSRKCFESVHAVTMAGSGNPAYRHGHALKGNQSVEYWSWQHMFNRCCDPTDKRWERYGGRGITICDRWKDFANFLADLGPKPSQRHQIDRLDNDGNYEPTNCAWRLPVDQSRNKSNNIRITHDGKTLCLKEWSEVVGINYGTLYQRVTSGWDPVKALTTPARSRKHAVRS